MGVLTPIHFLNTISGIKSKVLSVSDKIQIIQGLERGLSNSDVCKQHVFSLSTVSTVWKNREKVMSVSESNHAHKEIN